MKNFTRVFLFFLPLLFSFAAQTQSLQPFEGCPGQALAITRTGFNSTNTPYQVYSINAAGNVQAIGQPINLQINGFGLNNQDGFLYGIHESSNSVNPFFSRVDKNGAYADLGFLLAPNAPLFHVGVINTAAGTMDGKDNYYFTAAVFNLQNISQAPKIYVGKVENVSTLTAGPGIVPVTYTEIGPGPCAADLLVLLSNPTNGAFQDIAYNLGNGNIYTYLPASLNNPMAKLIYFNPKDNNPTLTCIDLDKDLRTPDLSGLYFANNASLYILTINGKYYKADVNTGNVDLVKQTTLPLLAGNLRGDMASCGKLKASLKPFSGCPGISLAITRPGNNSGTKPYQIYRVTQSTGEVEAKGEPITLQINGFGLNGADGFLYAMHESDNIVEPWFTRVGKDGDYEDIGKLTGPTSGNNEMSFINTAAGTIDTLDNYYFTAITVNPAQPLISAKPYLGKIANISSLNPGDNIIIEYVPLSIGNCLKDVITSISNPKNGLVQDIAYSPANGKIYTYLPAVGKIGYLVPGPNPILTCLTPTEPNAITKDLSGLFIGSDRHLYILTIDGKYYKGNTSTGQVTPITQSTLPLENGNLRGDMASCQKSRPEVILKPFTNCPGLAVAVTKPGYNDGQHPYQIYRVSKSTGEMTPSGAPIPLQINGFGLNSADGFLYAIHESSNVFNPLFTRVDKGGNYEDINIIPPPANEATRIGIVGTNAATIDGSDNYYFTALTVDSTNLFVKPTVYIGKIAGISTLTPGDPVNVTYFKINTKDCLDEILTSVIDYRSGVGQDIAFSPADNRIYTYFPAVGKIAYFDLIGDPKLVCITPATPNPTAQELSGLFIGPKGALYILTTDGKYYKGNVATGVVALVGQTNLPLEFGTLRGDMASCLEGGGVPFLRPFTGCPGVTVAVTRPGLNATELPYQIYTVNETTGGMQSSGEPIDLQINAFGLNNKDGFLYALHESSEITRPWFSRVGNDGNYEDINKLITPLVASAAEVGAINTAAGTMDGNDNYYFTALTANPQNILQTAKLYVGIIRNVSLLKAGDPISVEYKQIDLGTCGNEILGIILADPTSGILQDLAFDAVSGRLYTYLPQLGKLAYINLFGKNLMMVCMNSSPANAPAKELSGLFFGKNGLLYILTIDGHYYTADPTTGIVSMVTQTSLPLLNGNLRGDMASCVNPSTNIGPLKPIFIQALPNPIKLNLLLVKIKPATTSVGSEIQITDSKGFTMLRKKTDLVDGMNQLSVDISNLPKGIYVLSIIDAQHNRSYTKFIRE